MPTKSTKRPTKATDDDANANTAVDPKEHMLSTITSAGWVVMSFAPPIRKRNKSISTDSLVSGS